MFDFYKEVIVNSNSIEDGFKRFYAFTPSTTAEEIGSDPAHYRAPKEGTLRVLRCADYVKSGIKDTKVYRTRGTVGKKAELEINLNPIAGIPGQYRILIDISLAGRYYSDYKYPWSEFHKPIMVEFDVVTGMTSSIVDAAVKSLKLAIPSDYKYVVASNAKEEKLKITCSDPYQVIKAAKVQVLSEEGCLNGCANPVYIDVGVPMTIVPNVAPFGTGTWIQENLRFPSYPNLRYAALNSDETPVQNAIYTQFAFEYVSPRRGLHGQGTVGQVMTSVTHHVFYVIDSLAAEFEAEIKKAFGADSIVPMDATVTIINADANTGVVKVTADAVNGKTVVLEATYSGPVDGNADFVWAVTGPFKVEKAGSDYKLVPLTADVVAGATGTISASCKGAQTVAKVEVTA